MQHKIAQFHGNCKAAYCRKQNRRIFPGDPIYHDSQRGAWHAGCWQRHVQRGVESEGVELILTGVDVVCDTGLGRKSDCQYAAAMYLLNKVIAKSVVASDQDTDHIKNMVISDIDATIEGLLPSNNVEHFEWAANTLTRAGLPAIVNHGNCPGWGATLAMQLDDAEVHFSNTWGGDDGYTSYYRVYVTRGVSDVYDTWAQEVVFHDAGINECEVECHKEEFLGFVLEAMAALKSELDTNGWPVTDYERHIIAADDTDENPDPIDMDEVNRQIILTSLDTIAKRTGSERIQREVQVIAAAVHQLTGD